MKKHTYHLANTNLWGLSSNSINRDVSQPMDKRSITS